MAEGSAAQDASIRPPRTPITLITGASEGIGLALAREFARAGKDILLAARTKGRLEDAAKTLRKDFDVNVHICAVDLSAVRGCDALQRMTKAKNFHVEYLVNNAAIGICAPIAENEPEKLRRLVDLNMRTPADLICRFLGDMLERNAGGILNVGSLAAFLPGPYQAGYYASKAYLMSLTESLGYEASRTGLRIAFLAPGPVKTRFHESMEAESAWYVRFQGLMHEDEVARIAFNNFMCGQQIIIPGFINLLTAVSVRYIPHMLLTPFSGWLLRSREELSDA